MRTILTLSLVIAFTPALHADEQALPIQGTISKVAAAGADAKKSGVIGTFFIDAKPVKSPAYEKAIVRVTEKTVLRKKVGKVEQEATFADLHDGRTVTVTIEREVNPTDPPQVNAVRILIVTPAK